jgi:pilus assembly protein CpaE
MASTISAEQCPHFIAFASDSESLSMLRRFALAQGWDGECVHKGDISDAARYLSNHPGPDFLLVEVPDAASAPELLDQLADVCDPAVRVIVTSDVDEYSFFRWLTEIGIHHYLLKPLTENALLDAISASPTKPTDADEEKSGKLYAVMGTRGGVGASSVSLNVAAAIATHHQTTTALLDLDAQWGTLSLMLDLEPGRGLREALSKPDRIDGLFMERVMIKYDERFSILSSEEPFDEPISITSGAAQALIAQSRKKFAVTVADLPRDLSEFSLEFLKAADHILIVTELTLLGLRDAMRLGDLLRDKLGLRRVHFVANRLGMLPKHEMKQADFAKNLNARFYGTIPFDIEAYDKMATGEIATLQRTPSPMGKALLELANQLHRGTASEAAAKPRLLNWLKGRK